MKLIPLWRCLSLTLCVVLSCSVQQCNAQQGDTKQANASHNWSTFLGPSQRGMSEETGLLKAWPKQGPPVLWQKSIGSGYSAPSIDQTHIALHHLVGEEDTISLLNRKDGSEVWSIRYPNNFSDPFGYDSGPRCTPLMTEQFLYTLGAQGKLCCLKRASGEIVWSVDLQSEYNIPKLFFGIGCTPILDGNRLIVLVGGQPNSGVVAFNAQTGKELWAAVGKQTWDGEPTGWKRSEAYEWTGEEMLISYATPVLATIHNKPMVLCVMRQGLVALNPANGKEYFHYWFRSEKHESVNASCPVVIGSQILLTAAYGVGSVLLEVNAECNAVKELWKKPELLQAHWSTPIVKGDSIWAFSGRHENGSRLECVSWKTGELLWSTIGVEGPLEGFRAASNSTIMHVESGEIRPWPYYGRGSALWVDQQLIVLGERGTLALLNASATKWEELHRVKVPGVDVPSWTAPVLSNGHLLIRGEKQLVCYDLNP